MRKSEWAAMFGLLVSAWPGFVWAQNFTPLPMGPRTGNQLSQGSFVAIPTALSYLLHLGTVESP